MKHATSRDEPQTIGGATPGTAGQSLLRSPLVDDETRTMLDVWHPGPPGTEFVRQLRALRRRGGWVNRWRE